MAENKETWTDMSGLEWFHNNRPQAMPDITSRINTGCLQRIAAATELMAKDRQKMEGEIRYLRSRNGDMQKTIERLERANAALRGHLRRAKRKAVGNG